MSPELSERLSDEARDMAWNALPVDKKTALRAFALANQDEFIDFAADYYLAQLEARAMEEPS
jgi:hypothetical protein